MCITVYIWINMYLCLYNDKKYINIVNAVGRHMSCHSRIRAHDRSQYFCGWMQMMIIDIQLCPWKDFSSLAPRKEKEKQIKPSGTFIIQWNFFWPLRLIMCFNISNNLTTNSTYKILWVSMFPYENLPWFFLLRIKPKIIVLVAMNVIHKLTMVLLGYFK